MAKYRMTPQEYLAFFTDNGLKRSEGVRSLEIEIRNLQNIAKDAAEKGDFKTAEDALDQCEITKYMAIEIAEKERDCESNH